MSEDITIKISKKTFNFLKALHKELVTQDNRGTANPRYYVVEEETLIGGFELDSTIDGYRWSSSNLDSNYFYTKEEACREENIAPSSPYWQENLYSKGWELTGIRNLKVHSNVFLTEKAILHYMEVNRHNLTNPTMFLMYADKNPELLGLIEAIMEIGDKNG